MVAIIATLLASLNGAVIAFGTAPARLSPVVVRADPAHAIGRGFGTALVVGAISGLLVFLIKRRRKQ